MDERGAAYELRDIDVKDGSHVQVAEKTIGGAPASIDSQTRVRRLFSTTQIFIFSLTYMGLWEGMCTYVEILEDAGPC